MHLKSVLSTVGASYTDATQGVDVALSATVPEGFTATVNRTPPAADCGWVRDELAGIEAEIQDWQAELQQAAPPQKAGIAAAIKRLQAQAAKLRARAQQLGCSP